jgi:amidase
VKALEPALERLSGFFQSVDMRPISPVPLADWFRHQAAVQGREAWATFGDWIDRNNPRFGFEVADNFLRGSHINNAALAGGRDFLAARRREVAQWLDRETVVALPTTPFPAPPAGRPRAEMWTRRRPVITLTSVAGTLGTPQISIPAAQVDGLPVGLSILGAQGADGLLLQLVRRYGEGG